MWKNYDTRFPESPLDIKSPKPKQAVDQADGPREQTPTWGAIRRKPKYLLVQWEEHGTRTTATNKEKNKSGLEENGKENEHVISVIRDIEIYKCNPLFPNPRLGISGS